MADRFRRHAIVTCACLVVFAGCRSDQAQAAQHRRTLQSLQSTAVSVGQAWLDGSFSSRSARSALEKTYTLMEQERESLAATPAAAADPALAPMAREAEAGAGLLASMVQDVRASDRPSLRTHVAQLVTRAGR